MQVKRIPLVLLIVASSSLQVLCFPTGGPLPVWRSALAWFALVPLLWVLLPANPLPLRTAALRGYYSGVLWYLGTCYWVFATMHTYGELSVGMSLVALVLMCLYLALYHALFGLLMGLTARCGRAVALCAAPLLWVAVELARARITSFPWNLLGYSQIDSSVLTRLAPITGVYGISCILVAVNAAIASVRVMPERRWPMKVALIGGLFAAAVQNLGTLRLREIHTGTQKAVMLQPNLQVAGGETLPIETLAASSKRLSLQASAVDEEPTKIVLWPESPSPFQTDRPAFTTTATELADTLQAPVIADALGLQRDARSTRGYDIYNSAVLFRPGVGTSGRYDKIHLVPFGEFVPYANLFQFASGLTQAVGLMDRGTRRTPLEAGGHKYGVFICYESIFGDEVRQLAGLDADVLVNLSDDGWYGDSSAPFQHINMARMRAIENHRWLLRDTNNGITASIDPNGTVVETMQRHRRGAVAVHFDYLSGTTFYTRHGDVFAYACTLGSLALLGLAWQKGVRKAVN